jgi:hypothetical protein
MYEGLILMIRFEIEKQYVEEIEERKIDLKG